MIAIPTTHIHIHHHHNNNDVSNNGRYNVRRDSFTTWPTNCFDNVMKNHRTNDVPIGDDVKNTDDHILRRLPKWSRRPTVVEVDQSLSIVDSILRSWILPPLCVNTRALKQFVGLQNNNDNKVNNNSNYKRTSVSIGMASFRSLFRHATCSLYQSIGDSQSYHDNRSESYHIRCL